MCLILEERNKLKKITANKHKITFFAIFLVFVPTSLEIIRHFYDYDSWSNMHFFVFFMSHGNVKISQTKSNVKHIFLNCIMKQNSSDCFCRKAKTKALQSCNIF